MLSAGLTVHSSIKLMLPLLLEKFMKNTCTICISPIWSEHQHLPVLSPSSHSCRLQQAIIKASKKIHHTTDKLSLASSLKTVGAGVEMVFGSAAALSAAFGYSDKVCGLCMGWT